MVINVEVSDIRAINLPRLGHIWPRYTVACKVGGGEECYTKSARAEHHTGQDVTWKDDLSFTSNSTSKAPQHLVLRVTIKGTIAGEDEEIGTVTEELEALLSEYDTEATTRELQKNGQMTGTKLVFRVASPDNAALIGRATGHLSKIKLIPFQLASFLEGLSRLTSCIENLVELNSYAKVAFNIVKAGQKAILDQIERDENMKRLLRTITKTYGFLKETDPLKRVKSQARILEKIVKQTSDCARFIIQYAEKRQSWISTVVYVIGSRPDEIIQHYQKTFDELRTELNQLVGTQTQAAVFNVMDIVERVLDQVDATPLDDIEPYAGNTRFDPTKACLQSTRVDILYKITDWIEDRKSQSQVFLLAGSAGSGKSAIAHTIADQYFKLDRLGSSFFFDRKTRGKQPEPTELFSTIARNLADRNGQFKHALLDVIRSDKSLRQSTSPATQFNQLLVNPAKNVMLLQPMVIVIDALDEGGDIGDYHRRTVLDLLSSKAHELPHNFRILLTSRLEPDIQESFMGNRERVHIELLDDISLLSTTADVTKFISEKLKNSRLNGTHFLRLAEKAAGLFEWAAVSCRFIDDASHEGEDPLERYEQIVDTAPDDRRAGPIENHYNGIYGKMVSRVKNVDRFKSVMAQVVTVYEPLPAHALYELRIRAFPGSYVGLDEVALVLKTLGSVMSGVADPTSAVRPYHASFIDYLMDPARSKEYCISQMCHRELALGCLRLMNDAENGLRFNICNLASSYLPNSEQPGLADCIPKCIPISLRYACQHGARHLLPGLLSSEIVKELWVFLLEKLFFWLEAMSILSLVGQASLALNFIIASTAGYDIELSKLATKAQTLVHKAGAAIDLSAPHVYLSGLPVAAEEHPDLYSRMGSKFYHLPRILSSAKSAIASHSLGALHGHTDSVSSVAFSYDGTRIISGSYDKTIRLWDTASRRQLGEAFQGHANWVYSVAFSPDGTRIASGSEDNTIRIWDTASGMQLGEPLEGHTGWIQSVAFSPDGTCIVSGSVDTTIRFWEVASGRQLGEPLKGHTSWVRSVAFSPGGTCIVSGSGDETIRIWDIKSRKQLGEPLKGHNGVVCSVAFSPDGKRIASGSYDKTIRVWETESRRRLGGPLQGHTSWVRSVAFSPDGTRIVSGSGDGAIGIWDVESGRQLVELLKCHTHSVESVMFSPDGTRIVSGSEDTTIRLWDTSSGAQLGEPLESHSGDVYSVAFSPDGTRLVSGSYDKTIRVWDATSSRQLGEPLMGHTGDVYSIALSSDGTRIVSGSEDETIRLWETGTGKQIGEPLKGPNGVVCSVAFSPDGTRIVSGSYDKAIRIWDTASMRQLGGPLMGHTSWVRSVAFSPDGTRIISGSGDNSIRMWDVASARQIGKPLEGHTGWLQSVAFSPDGTRIVSASADKTIRIWDATSGKQLGEPLKGHTSWVRSATFSPDGTRIVSGSHDKTIRIWDVTSGIQLGEPLGSHAREVYSVAFSPDGTRVVSGSVDCLIRIWHSSPLSLPPVIFSRSPHHALPEEGPNPRITSVTVKETGWLVGPGDELFLFLSQYHLETLCRRGLVGVIGTSLTELDLSDFAHGPHWTSIYNI